MTPTPELTPRITPVARTDGKRVLNIFGTLAHNDTLFRSFLTLGSSLLQGGQLAPRDREIVILRVGWLCGSEYEFGQHIAIGRDAGVTDEEIARLSDCGEGPWDANDQMLVDFATELCKDNDVSEATWQKIAARFDDAVKVELLLLVGFYRLVSGFLNSARVALEPATAGWPEGSSPVRRAPRSQKS